METDGKKLIEKICDLLREEDILLYDAHIRQKIESLSARQLEDLINSKIH
jgi:hypothetical protein